MKIYLDLDGVFADLDRFITDIVGQRIINQSEFWEILAAEWRPFYRLKLIPDALRIITMLQHHDLEFLTALPESRPGQYGLATVAADKIQWVEENISRKIPVNTVVGGRNKPRWLEKNSGAVLIDDMPRNIVLWQDAGGIGVHHKTTDRTLMQLDRLGLL